MIMIIMESKLKIMKQKLKNLKSLQYLRNKGKEIGNELHLPEGIRLTSDNNKLKEKKTFKCSEISNLNLNINELTYKTE